MLKAIVIVGLGGAIGSIVRWILGILLNSVLPSISLGTLVANLTAGYLVGVFIAFFLAFPSVSPEWKLFFITGCMGGLSTFSTFSAEVALLLQQGRIYWAMAVIALHVIGSVSMTLAGFATINISKLLFR